MKKDAPVERSSSPLHLLDLFCFTWGIGLVALSSANGWAALLGPAAITCLLLFVSGVPLLEKKYAGRPDWEAYKAKTPKFFPWFPRA